MADSVITVTGKRKVLEARAGMKGLDPIAGMAFGDGAVGLNGEVIPPGTEDTDLKHELLRKAYTKYEVISPVLIRYTVVLSYSELAGKSINEVGLYDTAGDLVALKSFLNKGKDGDMEMEFEINDTF